MPSSDPRQHHLIPAFYLAGFTDTGAIDGKLHVFDYVRNRHYSGSPRQVGSERDYFRVYEPNEDPNVVEHLLAKAEQDYAHILSNIRARGKFNHRKEVGAALEMAALIQAKTRKSRGQLGKSLVATIHRKLVAGEVTEKQWEDLRAAELRAGVSPKLVPPFQVVRDLVVRGNWRPQPPRVLLVGLIGEMQQLFFESLRKREWEMMQTDPMETGGFITSDSPLVWWDVPDRDVSQIEADLADPRTEVTFPISKSAALVSYAGARGANCTATREVVAHVNSRTLFLSSGVTFFANKEFLLERKTGIGRSSDYYQYIRKARQRGIIRP